MSDDLSPEDDLPPPDGPGLFGEAPPPPEGPGLFG